MAERKIVVIDAGHGGADPGAKFEGRLEMDDALRLALAVVNFLSNNGVDVDIQEPTIRIIRLWKKPRWRMRRERTISYQFTAMQCRYRAAPPES